MDVWTGKKLQFIHIQLILLILTIGCTNSPQPKIVSENQTGLEIPDYVDQGNWDFWMIRKG